MQGALPFWTIAVILAALTLGIVALPILRGGARGARRATYDMQIHHDQLREIDADLARGTLSPEEARGTRIEVSRRLLAASEAERAEVAAQAAPRRLSRILAAFLVTGGLAATGLLYTWIGAPGLADQPLAGRLERLAAERSDRPRQAAVEAMVEPGGTEARAEDLAIVAKLREVLEARPDDIEGHRLLVRSLASLEKWAEARVAQERVVELLGADAGARDLVDAAELMILSARGYVSPEAETMLVRGLEIEPGYRPGRYYSGLALTQAGRPDLAYDVWTTLLAEGPEEAPWIAAIRAQIADVALQAGLPLPPGATAGSPTEPATPGPSAADVAAAQDMDFEDRQAMIESMVSRLGERLATDGGPPEDWARLIRALGVLGRAAEATAIRDEARTTFAGDAPALAALAAAARDAGLAP